MPPHIPTLAFLGALSIVCLWFPGPSLSGCFFPALLIYYILPLRLFIILVINSPSSTSDFLLLCLSNWKEDFALSVSYCPSSHSPPQP